MRREWPIVRLGDVADLAFGFPFSSGRYTDAEGSVRLLRGDNIVQGMLRWDGVKRWPATEVSGLDGFWLRDGDVVLAMDRPWIDAGLKYAAIEAADLPALLVQRVARLRGSDRLAAAFLRYVIGSPTFTGYVVSIQTGTAVPHVSGGQIRAYEFPLPSVPEQLGIAEVLGAIHEKIRANAAAQKTIEELIASAYSRWIAHATTATPTKLGTVAGITKGVGYQSAHLKPSSTALVSLKAFRRTGGYQQEGLKPYTGPYKSGQVVKGTDSVVAQTDLTQNAEVVGRVIRVPSNSSFDSLVASMDACIVRPAGDRVTPEFLFALLSSPAFRQHCRARANGTTVLHLAVDAIPSFVFDLPDQETVQRLTELVRPLWQQADALATETNTMRSLGGALLPDLLSGRRRVRPADREATGASPGARVGALA